MIANPPPPGTPPPGQPGRLLTLTDDRQWWVGRAQLGYQHVLRHPAVVERAQLALVRRARHELPVLGRVADIDYTVPGRAPTMYVEQSPDREGSTEHGTPLIFRFEVPVTRDGFTRRPKAADIDDLTAVAVVRQQSGGFRSATLWSIQDALDAWPPKVVLAKLRALLARGILDGCPCGCRGDYRVIHSAVREKLGAS